MELIIGRLIHRFLANLLILVFLVSNVPVYAQGVIQLPAPGTRLALSTAFAPPLLKGIKVYRNDPFRFDFILDKGDATATDEQVKTDSTRLIKYFLASLTVPEKDLWVNLSPYEKDRIVPEAFGQTEMGRDLLAQDYILKQITASVIYPEGEVGKEFWAKVYAEAQKRFGTTDVPVDTFNKVWIIPEKATVYENKDAAFVVESKLKVMLEEDYLALEQNTPAKEQTTLATNKLGSEIVREIVIPILEKEVNEGKNFAPLRQVYNSLILATWYKRKVRDSIMGQAYVDQQKTVGIDIVDKNEKEKIWQQYVEAFTKGAYNLIKEEVEPESQEVIPRKYFSGGTDLEMNVFRVVDSDSAQQPVIDSKQGWRVQMRAAIINRNFPVTWFEGQYNRLFRRAKSPLGLNYFRYLMVMHEAMEKPHQRRMLYLASGADVTRAVALLHGGRIDMVDRAFNIDRVEKALNSQFDNPDKKMIGFRNEYAAQKRNYGFSHWSYLGQGVEKRIIPISYPHNTLYPPDHDFDYFSQCLIAELQSLGLKRNDLNVSRVENALKVSFRLIPPGDSQEENYQFVFLNHDATDYLGLRRQLSLQEGVDILLDNGGMLIGEKYNDMLVLLDRDLNPGAFLLLNNYPEERNADIAAIYKAPAFVIHNPKYRNINTADIEAAERLIENGPAFKRYGFYGWKYMAFQFYSVRQIERMNKNAEQSRDPAVRPGVTPDAAGKGGIDLNTEKINLKTRNSAASIEFNFDPAMLQRVQKASGITPVIVNISSLESLTKFFEITP
ncbi:MAG: hypothetical protein HQL20_03360 [Candidatus Omnitrophica bacterium]|nr:hypothetical protein [Candidatus Omnitrophota bacterium]